MDSTAESVALKLILHRPNNDGSYEPEFADCLTALAKSRPAVVLAFAPKAAGTFLRSALIVAIAGQLVRTVYAQGGRDAQFYLPTFVDYFLGGVTPNTLVTHVHMQALPGNCNLIEALGLKPVIMLRSVPDMLASFIDMLSTDQAALKEGLNCHVPDEFAEWEPSVRAEYMIDMVAPWYASYYATWRGFVVAEPDRTLVLRYSDFIDSPQLTMQAILNHSGVPCHPMRCAQALQSVWNGRGQHRFNKGVVGRGASYFSPQQLDRIRKMLSRFKSLEPWLPVLS